MKNLLAFLLLFSINLSAQHAALYSEIPDGHEGTLKLAEMGAVDQLIKADGVNFPRGLSNLAVKINITAGSLSASLSEEEKSTLTNLTVTGPVDARDFKAVRNEMPLLEQAG